MTSNQLQAHFRTTLMKYVNAVIISKKKLPFPVPNFKIHRMLYGLFYMQHIAKPQGSSQNNVASEYRLHHIDNLYEMMLTALKSISNTIMTGLSVDIFVEGPGLPPFEFPRTSSKIWRVRPLKCITNSPILGGPLGPQAKFHKGPIGFLGPRGPYLPNSSAIYTQGFCLPSGPREPPAWL